MFHVFESSFFIYDRCIMLGWIVHRNSEQGIFLNCIEVCMYTNLVVIFDRGI
jgi:hypothetical protein